MSIKVGIFFGGPSREREISLAGGRTVYDNLDKSLFEAVPIFVDSHRRWHLLDWPYLYRGSIRDFFPPVQMTEESPRGYQIYQESLGPADEAAISEMGSHIGRRLHRGELAGLIDVAFLALHGEYGEDGQLQRELEHLGIPYTGSGVRASEIGMDKALQKKLMAEAGFAAPPVLVVRKEEMATTRIEELFRRSVEAVAWPLVIRPARQGSSIGVSILREEAGLAGFERALNAAFFREPIVVDDYAALDKAGRTDYVRRLSDLRDGLAFPLDAHRGDHRLTIYSPDDLYDYLEAAATDGGEALILLEGQQTEERVIVEGFIDGKEFSTIVLRTPTGEAVALPPTEIVKYAGELFDYRSKYLPGRSRKVTPIDLPAEAIQRIRTETQRLFEYFNFGVYARIDGFYTPDGTIYLNDPNTTSGMMPSSFFFHQAAEIGLNPSQFLTYLLRVSLRERGADDLGRQLDETLGRRRAGAMRRERVGVVLGGNSFERHISVESGRNVYEKLSSSSDYRPLPLFLTAGDGGSPVDFDYALYQLPVNLLLKDNADDIRDKLHHTEEHPVVAEIRRACAAITERYADPDVVFHPRRVPLASLPELVDLMFIALHGRPGEDGQLQRQLDRLGLPYNGSGPESSEITIDKYRTLQVLREHGLPVTEQWLASRTAYVADSEGFLDEVAHRFGYPVIAKPMDDGCSSAVRLLRDREQLAAYCALTFRPTAPKARKILRLNEREEWPVGKSTILFEAPITAAGADRFLEITGGMLTDYGADGELRYHLFEPSEALAGGEVLSLEEKFLAGEGQNLTPARLATEKYDYEYVADRVKGTLERAARLLGVEGYCRVDAFVRIYDTDGRVETVIIEVNSLPGMTPATAIFHQAALAGYQPYQFIAKLLDFAKLRHKLRAGYGRLSRSTDATAYGPFSRSTSPAADFTAPATAQKNTPLWKVIGKNLLAALAFLTLLFLLLRAGLNWYTHHGESMVVPTFKDMMLDEARRVADDKGLRLDVTEGGYDPERAGGTIVEQRPAVGSRVKHNRTIYLTVLRDEAPLVSLPSLVGNYNYERYTEPLERHHISSSVREREFDARQEDGTILYFFHDDRKITDEDLRAEGGVKVPMGAHLEFVITKRTGDQVSLPDVRCQTFGTAEFALTGSRLVIGRIFGDRTGERNEAYIERTEPAAGQTVAAGTSVDIYLSDSPPPDCD